METTEITVVGMGYVGMATAMALARHMPNVTCIGEAHPSGSQKDTRSTALFPDSITLLRNLGVWQNLESVCRPLRGIRLIDETRTLFRAPEVTFRADECGMDALALNVPNAALHEALTARIAQTPNIECAAGGAVIDIAYAKDTIHVRLENGSCIQTRNLVAADGRNSLARAAAGIGVKSWSYNQVAIACALTHTAPHHDISTEFHRPAGPLTIVPGPSSDPHHTSHLVWIETPQDAQWIGTLDNDAFCSCLEERLQGLLGMIKTAGPRGLFPIKGQTARTFAARNTFLVGEAAHVIPPIGAQGMNLGFRDVTGLGAALSGNTTTKDAMALYNEDRRNDVWMRTTAVDLLNRSLTTPYWPAQALRGVGLHALNSVPALKRALIQAGFGN